MSRYFTSDWHLGSANILKYANRPFANQIDAALKLLENCNSVAKREDVVFHVGDFWLDGSDRHGEIEDKNKLPAKYQKYVKWIDSRFMLLSGNHDDGHNVETDCRSMIVDLNQNWRNIYVSHFPSDNFNYRGPYCNFKSEPRVVLCGHVHDKWLLKYDAVKNVINVNVGVDVWNYKLVKDSEITELLDYFKATMWTKTTLGCNFALTRDAFEKFKIAHSAEVKLQRKQRKAEKLAKKGLTSEECERRKIEAMKKKGLI